MERAPKFISLCRNVVPSTSTLNPSIHIHKGNRNAVLLTMKILPGLVRLKLILPEKENPCWLWEHWCYALCTSQKCREQRGSAAFWVAKEYLKYNLKKEIFIIFIHSLSSLLQKFMNLCISSIYKPLNHGLPWNHRDPDFIWLLIFSSVPPFQAGQTSLLVTERFP